MLEHSFEKWEIWIVSDRLDGDLTTAIADIDAWWTHNQGVADFCGQRMFRIAGSPLDQLVPDGIENPYWEIIRRMPSTYDMWDGVTPYGYAPELKVGYREHLAKRYSWAIPSPGDITWMTEVLNGRSLVEIGAGGGYWSWQAQQAGVDVMAYEPNEPADNGFVEGREYTTILRDGHDAAKHHPDRALMLCWPNYAEPWAAQALAAYKGDLLIYIGEGESGCCTDDAFFELRDSEWTEAGESPDHLTWWGIHCRMRAYRR